VQLFWGGPVAESVGSSVKEFEKLDGGFHIGFKEGGHFRTDGFSEDVP